MLSSFGEKQLRKYGWSDGKGVGKNEQGIINPIKPSLKFDSAGVGFNHSDEFTLNWWEHLYNKSAQNIDKQNVSDKNLDNKEKAKTFDNKKFYLAKFKQGETLTNLNDAKKIQYVIEKEPEIAVEDEKPAKREISDDDLLKICKGRTAHKGARHGIKMNGKLARIMEQEQNLIEQLESPIKKRNANEEIDENNKTDLDILKKKKKKKKNDKIE